MATCPSAELVAALYPHPSKRGGCSSLLRRNERGAARKRALGAGTLHPTISLTLLTSVGRIFSGAEQGAYSPVQQGVWTR